MELDDAVLRMWRRFILVRERDPETGLYLCQVSGAYFRSWEVQAHHTKPKALYPELAYELSNGALVYAGLHQGAVHAGNPSKDLASLGWWKEWVPMFRRQNELAKRRHFNNDAQARIDAYAARRAS